MYPIEDLRRKVIVNAPSCRRRHPGRTHATVELGLLQYECRYLLRHLLLESGHALDEQRAAALGTLGRLVRRRNILRAARWTESTHALSGEGALTMAWRYDRP